MNRKSIILSAFLLLSALTLSAQQEKKTEYNIDIDSLAMAHFSVDSLPDELIDSYNPKKRKPINDYSMVGVQYGVGLTRTLLQPEIAKEDMMFMPVNVGVTYTKYGKMFGYMPYFGFQIGLFYTQEGYKFRYDTKNQAVPVFLGAQSAVMDVIEVPFLAHCHVDFWKMKLFLNAGLYGGYRLTMHRYAPAETADEMQYINLTPDYPYTSLTSEREFTSFENRFDYGIKGGLGFAFIFDPVEIHISASYKHSFSSLFKQDYYSKYYYRYSYQQNVVIAVGLHFQLGRRVGKTDSQIRKEARESLIAEKK